MKKTFFILFIIFLMTFLFFRDHKLAHLDPGVGKSIIDMHVHVAGLGYGDSGSFINENMRNNIRFPFYLWSMDVTEEELKQNGDRILFKKLSAKIADSKTIKKAVILAMDGFVDKDGVLNKQETQIYVPNNYVAKETALYDNLIFGASVNPNRTDALKRLQEVKEQGAVLVKWIPSIMNIDPSDPKLIPFYQLMAKLNIPLLSHTGMEKSFANARDELADPYRLKLPLEQGVTVIAAHIATTGKSEGEDNFTRILPMVKQYPNLYVDISSLTQINKQNYLARALKEEGIGQKMIYGTDWPLQFFPIISPWYHVDHISLQDAYHIGGIHNQWDRDVALKTAFGLSDDVFLRTGELLNLE
ncbi:MAG: amidohydrolase family protein [Gammaproteobacteria bacterium]|nr:amidohydrolase family protein [Gammaproteobacteria bacterium]